MLFENKHFLSLCHVFSPLRWTMTPETQPTSALKVLFPPLWQTSGR